MEEVETLPPDDAEDEATEYASDILLEGTEPALDSTCGTTFSKETWLMRATVEKGSLSCGCSSSKGLERAGVSLAAREASFLPLRDALAADLATGALPTEKKMPSVAPVGVPTLCCLSQSRVGGLLSPPWTTTAWDGCKAVLEC